MRITLHLLSYYQHFNSPLCSLYIFYRTSWVNIYSLWKHPSFSASAKKTWKNCFHRMDRCNWIVFVSKSSDTKTNTNLQILVTMLIYCHTNWWQEYRNSSTWHIVFMYFNILLANIKILVLVWQIHERIQYFTYLAVAVVSFFAVR